MPRPLPCRLDAEPIERVFLMSGWRSDQCKTQDDDLWRINAELNWASSRSFPSNMKYLFLMAALCASAGCATRTDLDKNSSMPELHRKTARHMVQLAMSNCVVGTRRYESDQELRDVRQINDVLGVKRLYLSGDAWYKAEMASVRMWDNFYYNAVTQEFICGEKNWGQRHGAVLVTFDEVEPSS